MQNSIKLNSSEWGIMECLWANAPLTIVGVWHAVKGETGWSKSTVNTLLGRMVDKGIIRYEEGRKAKEYYPCVTRDMVALSETKSLLKRVYSGSVGMMVSTLVEKDELTKEDIDELYDILRKAEGDINE
jgi:Predicted transcriptional regulator